MPLGPVHTIISHRMRYDEDTRENYFQTVEKIIIIIIIMKK